MSEQPETQSETSAPPEPMMKGRFCLYETPDGGFLLAYRLDGEDQDQQVHIPGFAVKMAKAQMGAKGKFGKMARMLGAG